jgi:rubrerythrin
MRSSAAAEKRPLAAPLKKRNVGRDFYARAATITRDARARSVFLKMSESEKYHLHRLQNR